MNNLESTTHNIQLQKFTFCKYRLLTINKSIELNFPQLLQLRQKVRELTTPEKLSEIIEYDNFVLLFVADKQHLLYLDIPQLIDLKQEIAYFFSSSKLVLI